MKLPPSCSAAKVRSHGALGLLAFAALLAPAPGRAAIRYVVSVAEPERHIFHVAMTIPDVQDGVVVQFPAWNALYQIRDFAYRVANFRATDEVGRPLPVVKQDKQTWRVSGSGTVRIEYAIFWDDPGPFNSQLDRVHAFLNLATILCYVPERRNEPARIAFDAVPQRWRIAVELPPAEPPPAGQPPRSYAAPSYDALVDAPVEMGSFEEFRLEGFAPPVRVVVHGDNWTREQLSDIVRRVVAYETQLMREVPYPEYLFIFHIGSGAGGTGGGMEHANSTAIFVDAASHAASVTAHEFFHLWNVKRIRPQSLEPVSYTAEQWTRALWFAEGVTSTYAAYTLLRTGLWTRQQFLDDLAGEISDLEARPARHWMSVEEASLDAWLEKYPAYRLPEYSISYYNKGMLIGVLLDILIRDATDNRASLDDVLRSLNETFAHRGRFYRDSADIRASAEQVAGRSLEEFFAHYVAGTDEPPWAEFLARTGLALKPRGRPRADFGFRASRGPDGGSLALEVEPESSAALAGVREGDALVELNGAPFPRNAERWLHEHQPGETVRLRVRRGAAEREVSFALGRREERTYEIEEAAGATDRQRRIREGLLRGITDSPAPAR